MVATVVCGEHSETATEILIEPNPSIAVDEILNVGGELVLVKENCGDRLMVVRGLNGAGAQSITDGTRASVRYRPRRG